MQIQLKEDVNCLKGHFSWFEVIRPSTPTTKFNYFEVNELWYRMKSNDRNLNPMINVMWLIVKSSVIGGQVDTFFWADRYFKFHA